MVAMALVAPVGPAGGWGVPPQTEEVVAASVNGDIACDQNGCLSMSGFASGIAAALAGNVEGYEAKVGASNALGGGFAQSPSDAPPTGVPMPYSAPATIATVNKGST